MIKTKNIFSLLIIAVVSMLFITSCKIETVDDLGKVIEKDVSTKPFYQIHNMSNADITLKQSDKFKVTVKAPEKILKRIEITNKEGVLAIESKVTEDNKVYITGNNFGNINVYIEVPYLNMLTSDGSGDITVQNLKLPDGIGIISNGSGNIDLNVTAPVISLSTMGSGDIYGKIDNAEKVNVTATGSGDVDLDVKSTGEITGSSTGSGDVIVKGKVKSFNVKSTGSGDVTHND